MSQKPQDPKSTLIAGLLVCAGAFLFLFFTSDNNKFIAFIVPPIVAAYTIYAYFRETKADSGAETVKQEVIDGSRFSSAQWRDEYLRYKTEHDFEKPDQHGMKADLCRRYRTKSNIFVIAFGVFFAACSLFVLSFPDTLIKRIMYMSLGLLLAAAMLYTGISGFMAKPVRDWYRRSKADAEAAESSYMNGKLLVYGEGGVNIGREFVIAFTKKSVSAMRPGDIISIDRKVVRIKNYTNSLYTGDEYQHFLVLKTSSGERAEVMLNEFQVEMAIEELDRIKGAASSGAVQLGERYDDIMT